MALRRSNVGGTDHRAPGRDPGSAETIFFFQAEDGIRDVAVTGVQTCALPISSGIGRLGLTSPGKGEVGKRTMECKDLQKRLLAYLYEELPSEERTVCDAHLAHCTRCQSELERTRRLHHLLSERPAEEPSPALVVECREALSSALDREPAPGSLLARVRAWVSPLRPMPAFSRSEEHTSELQSRLHLVCRLLLEKKKKKAQRATAP